MAFNPTFNDATISQTDCIALFAAKAAYSAALTALATAQANVATKQAAADAALAVLTAAKDQMKSDLDNNYAP